MRGIMLVPSAQSIQNHPDLLHDESQLAGEADSVYFPRTAAEVGEVRTALATAAGVADDQVTIGTPPLGAGSANTRGAIRESLPG